jgi:hypothetical protein
LSSPTTSTGRFILHPSHDQRWPGAGPSANDFAAAAAGDWADSSGGTNGGSESSVERKNLYVLNLPLDMTNEEMLGLFQPFGTVVHACILAILDSSARRRGFILMGSGAEATAAMRNLHGQVYRCVLSSTACVRLVCCLHWLLLDLTSASDYVLDVSYSVVQKTSSQRNCCVPITISRRVDFSADACLFVSVPDPSGAGAGPLSRPPGRSALSSSRAQPPASHYDALRALGQPIGRIAGAADGDDPRNFWSGLPGAAAAAAALGNSGGAVGGAYLQQVGSSLSHDQQQQQQAVGKAAWDARRPKRIITNGSGGGEVGLLVDNMVRQALCSAPKRIDADHLPSNLSWSASRLSVAP